MWRDQYSEYQARFEAVARITKRKEDLMRDSYLGTGLSPDEYYQLFAESYLNPHAEAIIKMLRFFQPLLPGPVLDLGCGAGLATKTIGKAIGVDRSPDMIERYKRETNCPGFVGNFWDKLPEAFSAMAIYSLHLCPHSRIHQFKYRLQEAGVKRLLVISPLKRASNLSFKMIEKADTQTKLGKTIYGWVFEV